MQFGFMEAETSPVTAWRHGHGYQLLTGKYRETSKRNVYTPDLWESERYIPGTENDLTGIPELRRTNYCRMRLGYYL